MSSGLTQHYNAGEITYSFFRGHKIYCLDDEWYYLNGERTVGNPRGWCGHCSRPDTENGHDACLGELQGVMNACCGHGVSNDAYIQFSPDQVISGDDAIFYIKNKAQANYNLTQV